MLINDYRCSVCKRYVRLWKKSNGDLVCIKHLDHQDILEEKMAAGKKIEVVGNQVAAIPPSPHPTWDTIDPIDRWYLLLQY